MKSLKKILAVGILAAWCGTAFADTITNLISGWGFESGYQGSGVYTITQTNPGNFSVIGTETSITSANNPGWRADFTPITIGVGEVIIVTGDFTITNSLGGGQWRIGLMNENGYGGTLNTSTHVWSTNPGGGNSAGSGIWGWTGYLTLWPSGGQGTNWNSTSGYGSIIGGKYNPGWNTTSASGWVSTTSGYPLPIDSSMSTASNVLAGTYVFQIALTNTGNDIMVHYLMYSLTTNAEGSCIYVADGTAFDDTYGVYYGTTGYILAGGATILSPTNGAFTYDALGFYIGTAGTHNTEFDFENVEVIYIPEPVSMALVGFGILTGGMFIRRRKG